MSAAGGNVSVVRLPQVHDTVKQGFITSLVDLAREKGVSAYVGDGAARWPAAQVLDVARLYRLALEKREAGARYHAVAEEGIPVRDIAEVIGRGLKVPVVAMSPEEAVGHFGWLAAFAGLDFAGFKCANAGTAGMVPDWPWIDRRSRTRALLRRLSRYEARQGIERVGDKHSRIGGVWDNARSRVYCQALPAPLERPLSRSGAR